MGGKKPVKEEEAEERPSKKKPKAASLVDRLDRQLRKSLAEYLAGLHAISTAEPRGMLAAWNATVVKGDEVEHLLRQLDAAARTETRDDDDDPNGDENAEEG